MSHVALQRVCVRMLHDPAFVERVFTDAAAALAGIDLTAEEKSWLLATDRRRYGADPLRARRALKALLDEFRCSGALAVSHTRRIGTLDGYFSSPIFHRCIQDRGSLALSFGDWLKTLEGDPRIAAIATLERAMAEARRGRRRSPASRFDMKKRWIRSPHVVPVTLPGGTLEAMQAVEQVLFEISLAPIAALAEDGPSLAHVPSLGGEPVHLLAERGEGDQVALSNATEGLCRLLAFAETSREGTALVEELVSLGADRSEAPEVLEGLVRDGSLQPSDG